MDDERLVCLVQEHPEMYDKKSPLYKLTVRKQSVWDAIGKELQCPGELCARRWTALCERFSKESRKLEAPSGSGALLEKPWPLLEAMMFLKQHIIPRPLRCSKNVYPTPQLQNKENLSPVASSSKTLCYSTALSPALQLSSQPKSSSVCLLESDVSWSAVSDMQSHTPSPNTSDPRKPKKKKRVTDDTVDELMVEAIQSFKSHCETTPPKSMVESFANFMTSTLSTVDYEKQTRIIKHVTTIVMDAVVDPNY